MFGFWTYKLNHNVKASHNHYHCQNVEQFNLNCSEMAETQPLTLYILYQIRNRQTKSRTHFRVGVHPITPQVHFWFTILKYEYWCHSEGKITWLRPCISKFDLKTERFLFISWHSIYMIFNLPIGFWWRTCIFPWGWWRLLKKKQIILSVLFRVEFVWW